MSQLSPVPNQYLDMVVSHLRLQITALNQVLETMEQTHTYADEYIRLTIKSVEIELNRLRKDISN
jgi:hypothetical protein